MLSTMSAVASPPAPIPTVSSRAVVVSSGANVMPAVCHGRQSGLQAPAGQQEGSFSALKICPLGSSVSSTAFCGFCSRANSVHVDDFRAAGLLDADTVPVGEDRHRDNGDAVCDRGGEVHIGRIEGTPIETLAGGECGVCEAS